MISYIDTDSVEGTAREISKRVTILEKYFDSLFKRLDNVPNGTKEWIGNQSKVYFTRIGQDKKQYIKLVNDLREISDELKNEASLAEMLIKKLN